MKATLYRLPARNMLVLDDGKTQRIEFAPTEVRATHIAQDAGAAKVEFGRIADLIGKKSQPIKMQ